MVGCGYVTSTPDNVEGIKAVGPAKVSVNPLTSVDGKERTSIGCRAAGPVKNPNDQSFENYIYTAFVNELRMAGAYDESADIAISGEIKELDFNSNIGAGKWMLSARVSSSQSEGYEVASVYEFSTNWVADKACQQVAQAFEPAVAELIGKIVKHPEFPSLVASN